MGKTKSFKSCVCTIIIFFCSFSLAEDKSYNLSFLVKVKESSESKRVMRYGYLVILKEGQSLLGAESKMEKPKNKDFFPRYYELGSADRELRQSVDLKEGSYIIQVILKKKRGECKVVNGRSMGECFPMLGDVTCAPLSIQVNSRTSESGLSKIECEVPYEQ